MVSGIYDIFNHICEQYFFGEDDNTSDYLSEGLMRSVIYASRVANKDSQDYKARSNLMRAATWALNTLVSRGKSTDWMLHMFGQSVGRHKKQALATIRKVIASAFFAKWTVWKNPYSSE